MAGFDADQSIKRRKGTIGPDHEDGRPILAPIACRRNDVARQADKIPPRTGEQMAHCSFGTQACALGNCRHGEQDSADRLGCFDKERAVYAAKSLKGFEEHEIARPAK